MGRKELAAAGLCNVASPPMPAAPRTPPPRNARTARKSPHGVLEVDWPFFGEMCRALALKIFREYDPEVVIGIARAGVIPGAVVASILQCDFASMAITRTDSGGPPPAIPPPPRPLSARRPLLVHGHPANSHPPHQGLH